MKRIHSGHLLALCMLFVAWGMHPATAQTQPVRAEPSQHDANRAPRAAMSLPEHFKAYASASIGHGRRCLAGVNTDADGMNQRPVVYATKADGKRVLWIAQLDLPTDMHQSRATHCAGRGDALYVLLQSDTQASQSLSQTLLRVVKLNASTGAVRSQRDVEVPSTYSAWVPKGATHFVWNGNRLVIHGDSRLASDRERLQKFSVRLDSHLKPQGSKP